MKSRTTAFAIALAAIMAAAARAQSPAPAGPGTAATYAAPASAAAPAAAPAAVAGPQEEGAQYGMTLREAWTYGGNIMYALSLLSVLGLGLLVYLLVVLRPAAVAPRALRLELSDKIKAGDLSGALTACEARPCPLASVALAGLAYVRNSTRCERDLLKDAMESEGARQAQAIEGSAQWLLDISVVAPMLGLLGTVLGMLKAFGSVASDVAAAKPVILAQGVSQAIVTTIFGLFVAIPAMVFFAFMRRRAARQVAFLESAVTDVMADIAAHEEP